VSVSECVIPRRALMTGGQSKQRGTFRLGDCVLIEVGVLELGVLASRPVLIEVPEHRIELQVVDCHTECLENPAQFLFIDRSTPILIESNSENAVRVSFRVRIRPPGWVSHRIEF